MANTAVQSLADQHYDRIKVALDAAHAEHPQSASLLHLHNELAAMYRDAQEALNLQRDVNRSGGHKTGPEEPEDPIAP